mgnify:FL=1
MVLPLQGNLTGNFLFQDALLRLRSPMAPTPIVFRGYSILDAMFGGVLTVSAGTFLQVETFLLPFCVFAIPMSVVGLGGLCIAVDVFRLCVVAASLCRQGNILFS